MFVKYMVFATKTRRHKECTKVGEARLILPKAFGAKAFGTKAFGRARGIASSIPVAVN